MDLGGWLRSLGLDQYEATFRANEIETDVLPELTEIDLEKLGGGTASRWGRRNGQVWVQGRVRRLRLRPRSASVAH
jgi:hypothetical protein